MEPKSPSPNFSPDNYAALGSQNLENSRNIDQREVLRPALEAMPDRSAQQPAASNSPVSVSLPILPTPSSRQDQAAAPLSKNPVSANDDDLIEKEWVDRAKKIISTTKDDPHRREVEIIKLQIDYLKKRYGRTIGDGS